MTMSVTVFFEMPLDLVQAAQQGSRADVVADLACGDEQAEGTPLAVAVGMQLSVQAAFGSANQAAFAIVSRTGLNSFTEYASTWVDKVPLATWRCDVGSHRVCLSTQYKNTSDHDRIH